MSYASQDAIATVFATPQQREQLARLARRRRWGPAFILVGWLHLLAFGFCYYLNFVLDFHVPAAYLATWIGEVLGCWLIFRLLSGRRVEPIEPLERFVRRVWITYLVLGFNLCSLHTLRGHQFFEFFPAIASLASFAFIMLAIVVDRRFFAAVLVMYPTGLLMAAFFLHAYLLFAIAWWLVLNGLGITLMQHVPRNEPTSKQDIRQPIEPVREAVGVAHALPPKG